MSELRAMLEETVARLFSDRVDQELIEAAETGIWPQSLWRSVEESGLTKPHLAESNGGVGGTWLEAFVILWASGRHTAPLPLVETMLAGWLLERGGIDVPAGALSFLPTPLDAAALSNGTLTAVVDDVPWGRHASHFVALVGGKTNRVGLLTMGNGVTLREGENLAREPRDTLTFDNAPLLELHDVAFCAATLQTYAAMLRSAQMAGAMQTLLDQSVSYANERIQFGRPIAKFQIIQQQLAVLAGHVAACNTAAEAAFRSAARGTDEADLRTDVAVAKIRIGDCIDEATSIAHQVHGAIGFTYEHSLHFATRRLWSWRAEHGTDTTWAAELGRKVITRGADFLWPDLTER